MCVPSHQYFLAVNSMAIDVAFYNTMSVGISHMSIHNQLISHYWSGKASSVPQKLTLIDLHNVYAKLSGISHHWTVRHH